MKSHLDRRTFLKDAGALGVASALMASGASTAVDAASGERRISAVLFDSRYSSCREFARVFVREGAAAFDARADIAALWYGPLKDHLAKHGGPVAGLTTDSDFVVSESFGREYRLFSRYEGSHDSRGSAAITHRLRGLQGVPQVESALRHADSNWAEAVGRALARTRPPASARQWESSIACTSHLDDHPGFLRSWLLAAQDRA